MDLTFLLEYINVINLGICLCIGFVIKQSITFIPNKFIPLIMLIIGTTIAILTNVTNITAEIILSGMLSDLASTRLHELFKNLLNKKEE